MIKFFFMSVQQILIQDRNLIKILSEQAIYLQIPLLLLQRLEIGLESEKYPTKKGLSFYA